MNAFSPMALDEAGLVHRVGGEIDLDDRVSWCPPGVSRKQFVAGYVIQSSAGGVLLIDSGLRSHQEAVLRQLEEIVPADTPISVLLTRTEMECCLNLPAIEERFRVAEVWYTGGITVPRTHAVPRRVSVDPGTSLVVEPVPGVSIELFSPLLRLLPTFWVYHPDSAVLLTSDAFTYNHDGTTDPDDGLVKFSWVSRTNSRPIAEDVMRVVRDRDVSVIAPGYGEPIHGRKECLSAADDFALAIDKRGLQKS